MLGLSLTMELTMKAPTSRLCTSVANRPIAGLSRLPQTVFRYGWHGSIVKRSYGAPLASFGLLAPRRRDIRPGPVPAEVRSFPLPDLTEAITVSQMRHPRLDADPAHRWLRGLVLATCREPGSVINTDKAPTQ
jgi:hypothetical protein